MNRGALGAAITGLGMAFGCAGAPQIDSLEAARKTHSTHLLREDRDDSHLPDPPPDLFVKVKYPTDLGPMNALVGADPHDGQRHSAVIWITGGFPPGGIDETAWSAPNVSNEQSAQAYRHAGLVMMYPCFRGACGNPGVQEDFYGEVGDVVAALNFVKTLDYVDPERIYLGGHSTGATLALLAAAATNDFAGVFALGPVADPAMYGADSLHFDPQDQKEAELRAPGNFLHTIRTPTWVIEGEGGNAAALLKMQLWNRNESVSFILIEGADHFDVIHSVNSEIAAKVREGAAVLELDGDAIQKAWSDANGAH